MSQWKSFRCLLNCVSCPRLFTLEEHAGDTGSVDGHLFGNSELLATQIRLHLKESDICALHRDAGFRQGDVKAKVIT